MPANNEKSRSHQPVTTGSAEGSRYSHREGWGVLAGEDNAFATGAIVRAHHLRREGADPGDTYLEGMADLRARQLLAAAAAAHDRETVDMELHLFDPDTLSSD